MIPDRTLVESDGVDQFDVSAYFSDPDGDDLSYAATSTDSDVAGVRLVGATLAVTPIGVGTATVEVTAADPGGMSIDQDFLVQVVAASGRFRGILPDHSDGAPGSHRLVQFGTRPRQSAFGERRNCRAVRPFAYAGPGSSPEGYSVQSPR